MNKLACLLMTLIMVVFMPVAHAADNSAGLSVAVVDVQKLMRESKAAKSLQGQLKAKREQFEKEFAKHEQTLRETEQAIVKEKASLSPEELADKRGVFEEKLMETRKLFQKRRNALEQGLDKATTTLRKEIVTICAGIAEEKGYQMLLSRDDVVIVEKSLDITAEVMEKLNKDLPEIKLSVE